MAEFKIVSEYKMCGDQPEAVERLVKGLNRGYRHQTLMGVTGSGKTLPWRILSSVSSGLRLSLLIIKRLRANYVPNSGVFPA